MHLNKTNNVQNYCQVTRNAWQKHASTNGAAYNLFQISGTNTFTTLEAIFLLTCFLIEAYPSGGTVHWGLVLLETSGAPGRMPHWSISCQLLSASKLQNSVHFVLQHPVNLDLGPVLCLLHPLQFDNSIRVTRERALSLHHCMYLQDTLHCLWWRSQIKYNIS